MMLKTTGTVVASLALVLMGCGKSDKQPGAVKSAPDVDLLPAASSPELRAKRVKECWDHFNKNDRKTLGGCYLADATIKVIGTPDGSIDRSGVVQLLGAFRDGFPDLAFSSQLLLASGTNVASVVLASGNHTAEFLGLPASQKPIGLLMAHLFDFDAEQGAIAHHRLYMDAGTMLGQLGAYATPHRPVMTPAGAPPAVIVAGDTAQEKDNIALVKASIAARSAGDSAAYLASLHDDVVIHDMTLPADGIGKAAAGKVDKPWLASFEETKLEPAAIWAAGDYVVAELQWSGKNTKPIPSMGLTDATSQLITLQSTEISRLEDGVITEVWALSNGFALADALGLLMNPEPTY